MSFNVFKKLVMYKVLLMFCRVIIQKMSSAQTPDLSIEQLEDRSLHYPYISCFEVVAIYSSVTLGFLKFQRPSSEYFFQTYLFTHLLQIST